MTAAVTETPRPLFGIFLVVLATLAFAGGDVVTKHLAASQPVAVIYAVRYIVNVLLLTVFLGPRLGQRLWRAERRWLVFLRGICLALASYTLGLALRLMPVGETIAIIYLAPFAVMLLAIPVLGERVGLVGWLGATLGFTGVLLIVRPGGGLDPLGVTFALINAGLGAAYHLLTRFLARTETTIALLYNTAIVGTVFFCILSIGALEGLSLGWTEIGFMVLLGLLATLGHYLLTAAYREAPASLLAPINYLHLVWAGGLGLLVFGHLPDTVSLAGMALVCVAGAVVAFTVRPRPAV